MKKEEEEEGKDSGRKRSDREAAAELRWRGQEGRRVAITHISSRNVRIHREDHLLLSLEKKEKLI